MTSIASPYTIPALIGYSIMFAFVFLVVVALLYYFKPLHRNTVGILALIFGVVGSFVCMGGLMFSVALHSVFVGAISLLVLLSLEIPTVYIGLKGTRLLAGVRRTNKEISSK